MLSLLALLVQKYKYRRKERDSANKTHARSQSLNLLALLVQKYKYRRRERDSANKTHARSQSAFCTSCGHSLRFSRCPPRTWDTASSKAAVKQQ